jgi:hypothetical protein
MNREAGKIVTKALKLYGELFAQKQSVVELRDWAADADLPPALRKAFAEQLDAAVGQIGSAGESVYALMEALRKA